MEYVKNELLRCKSEMRKASKERYSFLYAIQQAMEWVLDPMSYATPIDTVLSDKVGAMDIPASSKDCSAAPRPTPSLGTCSRNGLPQQ